MGRRSLRKIPATLDISPYITEVEKLPQPWDAAELFEADAPLEIEVGCGKGLFMATVSAKHPERNFLGIEVRGKYARFAASRLARDKRSNAKMVHGDALAVFHNVLPAECLAGVHVYFPDPWWKARHHKRRVLNEPFMKDVQRVLAPGGLFHLWTDVEEYYTSSVELIDQCFLLGRIEVVGEASHRSSHKAAGGDCGVSPLRWGTHCGGRYCAERLESLELAARIDLQLRLGAVGHPRPSSQLGYGFDTDRC